jgi:hypothetical protein
MSEKMSDAVSDISSAGCTDAFAVAAVAAIAPAVVSLRVSSENGRGSRSKAPTLCASALGLVPL